MVEADSQAGFEIRDRRRQPGTGEPTPAGRTPEPGPAAPDAERSLAGLVMMLASSALIALGEAPDPVSGQTHRKLEQAASLIDLLILLREKTEGNLSPHERQFLDEVLHDLQIRYVRAAKRS